LLESHPEAARVAATRRVGDPCLQPVVELADELPIGVAPGGDQMLVRSFGQLLEERGVTNELDDSLEIREILLERDVVIRRLYDAGVLPGKEDHRGPKCRGLEESRGDGVDRRRGRNDVEDFSLDFGVLRHRMVGDVPPYRELDLAVVVDDRRSALTR